MTTAALLSDARQRLDYLGSVLGMLQSGDPQLVPDGQRDEVYRNWLLSAIQVTALVTEARQQEGADRLWRDLQPASERVYLCASFSRQREMLTHAAFLRSFGVRVVSRWLQALPDDPSKPEQMRGAALECLEDIASVDTVLAFSEPVGSGYWTGGRHVEIGYALALRKRVLLVGPVENVFHAHPGVTQCDSLLSALSALGIEPQALGAVS